MNYKAIPENHMTVGELAKRMNITVRTLQYYDKQGILSPSTLSVGGRRLYTDKDMVMLHQILSLKSLGFSLEAIKENLQSLDTPEEVSEVLQNQAESIERQVKELNKTLEQIKLLRKEVLQIKCVDFKKYADIIVNLQMNNKYYSLLKRFDDHMLDHIRIHFDKKRGLSFLKAFEEISDEIIELKNSGIAYDSEQAQVVAKKFWDMVMEFTNGDMTILPQLVEIGKFENPADDWEKKQVMVNEYIEPAIGVYFASLGVNPFMEEKE